MNDKKNERKHAIINIALKLFDHHKAFLDCRLSNQRLFVVHILHLCFLRNSFCKYILGELLKTEKTDPIDRSISSDTHSIYYCVHSTHPTVSHLCDLISPSLKKNKTKKSVGRFSRALCAFPKKPPPFTSLLYLEYLLVIPIANFKLCS